MTISEAIKNGVLPNLDSEDYKKICNLFFVNFDSLETTVLSDDQIKRIKGGRIYYIFVVENINKLYNKYISGYDLLIEKYKNLLLKICNNIYLNDLYDEVYKKYCDVVRERNLYFNTITNLNILNDNIDSEGQKFKDKEYSNANLLASCIYDSYMYIDRNNLYEYNLEYIKDRNYIDSKADICNQRSDVIADKNIANDELYQLYYYSDKTDKDDKLIMDCVRTIKKDDELIGKYNYLESKLDFERENKGYISDKSYKKIEKKIFKLSKY